MKISVSALIPGLAVIAAGSPLLEQRDSSNTMIGIRATNTTGTGRSMQVTVTGYEDCTSKAMACPILGVDTHSPTAALSASLIPKAGEGLCGTCWRITNAYTLTGFGPGKIPVKGSLDPNSQANKGNGMVVLINNSCAKGIVTSRFLTASVIDGRRGSPSLHNAVADA
ncbi:MAG: hypothetical protein Q9225_002267 [Loekoesia sp. 1 TL-2023]